MEGRRPGQSRGRAAGVVRRARRVCAGGLRGQLRRRAPGGSGAPVARGLRGDREAHHRRPGRVALPAKPARAAHRGRPRPAQRRGVPGLHPRLPVLPGRHDHPPRPGAAGRAGPFHGGRRAAPHRLRRGGAHLPLHGRLLGHRGRGQGRGRRRRLRACLGLAALAAGRRVRRGDRVAAAEGSAHRPDVRAGGRHVAHAPGHQQAHPRSRTSTTRSSRRTPRAGGV